MKKHLFRIIAVLSAAVLLAGCAASRLRLGAAAAGGVYNAFGTAMAAQNSTIEVKQTAGSAANLRLLAGGYLQLAVAQSDMAQDAYDGSGVFAHESTERSFSAVAALYEEPCRSLSGPTPALRRWRNCRAARSASARRNPAPSRTPGRCWPPAA